MFVKRFDHDRATYRCRLRARAYKVGLAGSTCLQPFSISIFYSTFLHWKNAGLEPLNWFHDPQMGYDSHFENYHWHNERIGSFKEETHLYKFGILILKGRGKNFRTRYSSIKVPVNQWHGLKLESEKFYHVNKILMLNI